MKYQFISENCSEFRVEKMCRALKIKRNSYYAWRNRGKSNRELENERILEKIKQIHRDKYKIYGSPRIYIELNKSEKCGLNRVARIMRKNGIQSRMARKFHHTTDSRHNKPIAPDLVNRDFTAEEKNKLWCSDITYIRTKKRWLYLAIIMDVFNREIVGWSLAPYLTDDLIISALRKVLSTRRIPKGLIFHSDRGSQYVSERFRNLLKSDGIIQSMGSAGDCYDNAIAESFFHSLKTEWVYFEKYEDSEDTRASIFEYIEMFYNRTRLHSSLGWVAPINFELTFKERGVKIA